jgi:hypothetical protein
MDVPNVYKSTVADEEQQHTITEFVPENRSYFPVAENDLDYIEKTITNAVVISSNSACVTDINL